MYLKVSGVFLKFKEGQGASVLAKPSEITHVDLAFINSLEELTIAYVVENISNFSSLVVDNSSEHTSFGPIIKKPFESMTSEMSREVTNRGEEVCFEGSLDSKVGILGDGSVTKENPRENI